MNESVLDEDEGFLQSEYFRIEYEAKELEITKTRFRSVGLIWMSKKQAREALNILLAGCREREKILDILALAQWHYMDLIDITVSGLFSKAQLLSERQEKTYLLKQAGNVPVFEEEQCALFMSEKHNLPLRLCAAYVLGEVWNE